MSDGDERVTGSATDAPASVEARDERLHLSQHLAFALPGLFGAAMGMLVAVYMGKFYVDVVLLPAGLYAVGLAAGRALDAITDPMMGWISDHTRSRWGRRKPWILLGVLGNAVVFYLMLTPGAELSTAGAMTWFLSCYLCSFIFQTMSNVPRQALGAELTMDTQERVKLYGMLTFFAGIGLMVATPMPQVLERAGMTDQREQMGIQAGVYVIGYILVNLWLLYKLRERRDFMGRGESPFAPGVRRAMRNRPFLIMFISHIITAIPVAIPASLMPFFVQYVLKADDDWTPILIGTYLLSGMLALPLWMRLAARWGKLKVWLLNGFIGVTGGLMMFMAGEGDTTYVWFVECYVGMQAMVWNVLGGAMHADVIDYDELQTGKRREAQFSSLWSIIPKFSMIPGAAIPLAILGGSGYVPNEPNQSAQVIMTLSVLFALVPAGFNAIGISIMWWYPLSEENHGLIRDGIAKHAAGEAALDPITGEMLPPPGQREVDEDTGWFLDNFSRRELGAYLKRKTQPVTSVLVAMLASAGLCALGVVLAVQTVPGFDRDPGPIPSLCIVLAGLSLAATLFHALRMRPALRMREAAPETAVIERHHGSV
ncbi:MAG: MFS transporter [Myxococcales bacterium]|nr:MFS transporter [Myxococcales bacterium]